MKESGTYISENLEVFDLSEDYEKKEYRQISLEENEKGFQEKFLNYHISVGDLQILLKNFNKNCLVQIRDCGERLAIIELKDIPKNFYEEASVKKEIFNAFTRKRELDKFIESYKGLGIKSEEIDRIIEDESKLIPESTKKSNDWSNMFTGVVWENPYSTRERKQTINSNSIDNEINVIDSNNSTINVVSNDIKIVDYNEFKHSGIDPFENKENENRRIKKKKRPNYHQIKQVK